MARFVFPLFATGNSWQSVAHLCWYSSAWSLRILPHTYTWPEPCLIEAFQGQFNRCWVPASITGKASACLILLWWPSALCLFAFFFLTGASLCEKKKIIRKHIRDSVASWRDGRLRFEMKCAAEKQAWFRTLTLDICFLHHLRGVAGYLDTFPFLAVPL